MTIDIESLGAMAVKLVSMEVTMFEFLHRGLDRALVKVEKTAKAEFGVYQPAVGRFGAWDELADETKAERLKLGFTENDPLLRTGELRDHVTHEAQEFELAGVVGVKSGETHAPYEDGGAEPDIGDVMMWQELGTEHIPPRPVLGPAAFRNKEAIQYLIGAAVVAGFVGESEAQKMVHSFVTEDA
jgi:hypothetical protein